MTHRGPTGLTGEQKGLWDERAPHLANPSGDQTRQQAVNLAVLTFLFWCDFAGVGWDPPGEDAIKAEFEAAGASELCPSEDFWELLRQNPGYPWILAPGANLREWDVEHFGRPNVHRMGRRRGGGE